MKKYAMFAYSIICYLIGFSSILFWILSLSHMIPAISIDRPAELSIPVALAKNLGLILLFAVPHSVMARQSFKNWITRHIPRPIERSTYVLQAGLLLGILVWQWAPMGGEIWSIASGSTLYYSTYVLFFLGWGVLFLSSFLINHFDLFGLRQTYLELRNQPYKELHFRVISLYKYVRHPLYLGGIMGLWFTPVMSTTHLVFAICLTSYFFIGALFEERDLKKAFGEKYKAYAAKTPMMIPLTKWKKKKASTRDFSLENIAEPASSQA